MVSSQVVAGVIRLGFRRVVKAGYDLAGEVADKVYKAVDTIFENSDFDITSHCVVASNAAAAGESVARAVIDALNLERRRPLRSIAAGYSSRPASKRPRLRIHELHFSENQCGKLRAREECVSVKFPLALS